MYLKQFCLRSRSLRRLPTPLSSKIRPKAFMEDAGLSQVPKGQYFHQTRSTSTTNNKAPATKLGASSEDAYRTRTIQDMMSLKGRVTVVTGRSERHNWYHSASLKFM
jgi:hypothetical protein